MVVVSGHGDGCVPEMPEEVVSNCLIPQPSA